MPSYRNISQFYINVMENVPRKYNQGSFFLAPIPSLFIFVNKNGIWAQKKNFVAGRSSWMVQFCSGPKRETFFTGFQAIYFTPIDIVTRTALRLSIQSTNTEEMYYVNDDLSCQTTPRQREVLFSFVWAVLTSKAVFLVLDQISPQPTHPEL